MPQRASDAIAAMCDAVIAACDDLNALDAALGDGDHGMAMAKSFRAVRANLPAMVEMDLPALLERVSQTLLSTTGGAAAPLLGTAFAAAGTAAREMGAPRPDDDGAELIAAMIRAAFDAVSALGGARVGDKTMLDALGPAADAAATSAAEGAGLVRTLTSAADAAASGAAATAVLQARVGRASRLGARSVGSPDPGATSVAILIRAAADELAGVTRQ